MELRRSWPDRLRSRPALLAALASGLLALLLWLAFKTLIGQPPWTHDAKLLGDLGNQSLPFMSYYRDVLTGRANGNFLFAWGMSYGQSFWATFAQYLGNPFYLVSLAFPRTSVPDALFTAQILTGTAAAVAMSAALSQLRRGHLTANVALSTAWGLNAFACLEGSVHPYWVIGSVSLPLLVTSATWVARRSAARWFIPPLVGVLLFANFYTTYMATIGAGIAVLALMVSNPERWPAPVRTLLSWAGLAALGALMAAITIVPTYLAVQQSAETRPATFDRGLLKNWVAALLPGTDTLNRAPNLSPGIALLSLACAALVAAALSGHLRRAATWTVTLALVVLSIAVAPTSLVWHGGDVPDGNFFRQAWVVTALLVLALWDLLPAALEAGRPARIAGAAVAVGVLAPLVLWAGPRAAGANPALVPLALVLVLAGGLVALTARKGRLWWQGVLVVLVAVEVLVGHVTAYQTLQTRYSRLLTSTAFLATQGPQIDRGLQVGQGPSAGLAVPTYRSTNGPLLLGGTGMVGYSTMVPLALAHTMEAYGASSEGAGRRLLGPGNPLEDAVFGLTTSQVTTRTQARWVAPSAPTPLSADATSYDAYRDLLGPDVVQPVTAPAPGTLATVRCAADKPSLYADGRLFRGRLEVAGVPVQLPPQNLWRGHLLRISTEATAGLPLRVTPAARTAATVPRLFCAPAAPAQIGEAAQISRQGSSFSVPARPAGTAADLFVPTSFTNEWHCETAGRTDQTYQRAGLLVVRPAAAGGVSCSFVPVGWRIGLAVSGVAVLVWLALLAVVVLRRRRRASSGLASGVDEDEAPVGPEPQHGADAESQQAGGVVAGH